MKWVKISGNDFPKGQVLVTNNHTATGSDGNMSHVWLSYIYKKGKTYIARHLEGMSVVAVQNVTHYCEVKFDESPEPIESEINELKKHNAELTKVLHEALDTISSLDRQAD